MSYQTARVTRTCAHTSIHPFLYTNRIMQQLVLPAALPALLPHYHSTDTAVMRPPRLLTTIWHCTTALALYRQTSLAASPLLVNRAFFTDGFFSKIVPVALRGRKIDFS